jgi:hypothetical protein
MLHQTGSALKIRGKLKKVKNYFFLRGTQLINTALQSFSKQCSQEPHKSIENSSKILYTEVQVKIGSQRELLNKTFVFPFSYKMIVISIYCRSMIPIYKYMSCLKTKEKGTLHVFSVTTQSDQETEKINRCVKKKYLIFCNLDF